jgi:uncharacterized membrane protein
MLRKIFFSTGRDKTFRLRSKEVFRIEGLSDAVFAFSVSLLVASLEVPQTFAELKLIIQGAVPFFLTVALVFLFWYRQYIFFRRYGVNDLTTIVLNLVYLGVIVFYVYPLKFLFSLLISSWTGLNLFEKAKEQGLVVLSNQDFPQLIILFSIGYFLIWLVIYFMHQHILQQTKELALNAYELLFTQKEIRGALWNATIGLVALVFAFLNWESMAGITYCFIPIVLLINHYLFEHAVKKIASSEPTLTG